MTENDDREALNEVLLRGFTDHANGARSLLLGVYLADRILTAGFRRQGPIADAQLLAALNAYDPRFATDNLDDYAEEHQADMRNALEAARDA